MSKHTPGPWSQSQWDVWKNPAKIIARCRWFKDHAPSQYSDMCISDPDEAAANARLIAQAPAYHEAVGRLIKFHRLTLTPLGEQEFRRAANALNDAMIDLERIHAKAGGE